MSIDEQETIINMFPKKMSKHAEIYSCIPAMENRLRRFAENNPKEVTIIEKDDAVFATVPASWIRITPKRKCHLTDEQKKANAERLRAYKEAKQNDAT